MRVSHAQCVRLESPVNVCINVSGGVCVAIAIQPGPATDVGAWRRGVRDRKKKKKRSARRAPTMGGPITENPLANSILRQAHHFLHKYRYVYVVTSSSRTPWQRAADPRGSGDPTLRTTDIDYRCKVCQFLKRKRVCVCMCVCMCVCVCVCVRERE